MFKYELGVTVRHLIHGFEGVAIARSEHITGCNRYTVQPRGLTEEGKPKDAFYMDEHALELLDTPKVAIEAVNLPFKFEMGATVRHTIIDLEGVIIGRSNEINTNGYAVQAPSLTKDGAPQQYHWFMEAALVLVNDKKVVLPQPEKPGGPETRARSGGPR